MFISTVLLILFQFEGIISVRSEYTCPIQSSISVSSQDIHYESRPNVNGIKKFFNGIITEYLGLYENVTSPIIDESTGKRTVIGSLAQMNEDDALEAVESAKSAWKNGQGEWPQMSSGDRIKAVNNIVESLKEKREEIANVLMWEICKTIDDALLEVDRTIAFILATIEAYKSMDTQSNWKTVGGIYARVRRAAIGILLCLGPFNYPLNETYATLIPALLAGNVAILKVPTLGGLAHILTMDIYAKHLPPGVINFVSGPGRVTVSPMMKTGYIDMIAFIGSSSAADSILKDHPTPHRLNSFLQLEGKNVGVVLPDANIDTAVEQITLGSLSYNGQRCTAIKLVIVHESRLEEFLNKFTIRVDSLVSGLPWIPKVSITPLPEGTKKLKYLEALISDAVEKGARVVNEVNGGGHIYGNLMKPAIICPVTKDMKLYHEEQFGPVVPITTYSSTQELLDYFASTPYGLQAALFTENPITAAPLVDVLSTCVGRINLNTQCGRSPDSISFTGRRSSALGTMSVSEAIRAFSIETVVAGKATESNTKILNDLESYSKFLFPL